MAGDYLHWQLQYRRKDTDVFVAADTDYSSGDGTAIITPKSTSYTLYIQRIVVSPTTYAAKTWTFQDSSSTPKPIALLSIPASAPTSAGDVPFVFDFGPTGIALTEGKNLLMDMSATGAAAAIHIEAYEKLTGSAVAAGSTN